jgi:hypothetical protein
MGDTNIMAGKAMENANIHALNQIETISSTQPTL